MKRRPRLLFVSPRFLLPADSGGKIRTSEILRNLKSGAFEIILASPASAEQSARYRAELEQLADRFVAWAPATEGVWRHVRRVSAIPSHLPIPVATDRSRAAQRLLARELADGIDVVVFDFAHAAVLAPARIDAASVLFTHNVEAEIFERHTAIANSAPKRAFWTWQTRKMLAFERAAVQRFDTVIAVSERDAEAFRQRYAARFVETIPTGVDSERLRPTPRTDPPRAVFIGSMDWMANVDGIRFFMEAIWPLVAAAVPEAAMTVVGRAPPKDLKAAAVAARCNWTFTGYVDDVRDHVQGAAASVIPLRVGGGTRIKAYEAMAMGIPVVSTSIGIEGLPVQSGRDCFIADTPREFADALIRLFKTPRLGEEIAATARRLVEERFSNRTVARRFEEICSGALARRSHAK